MESKFHKNHIFGKFILDSISIGMYNHPLTLYREYIQNSSDAIDDSYRRRELKRDEGRIDIQIDGSLRSISIKDNGCGVPAQLAQSTLHNIGKSDKGFDNNRGFRGIGRLGGIGYCDEMKFISKAKNELVYSISLWDCAKLRQLISNNDNSLDAKDVIQKTVKFSQLKYEKNAKDHFFVVEMKNVKCSRDYLLNVPAVKSYISQIAPVPFNHEKFSFGDIIEKNLREKVRSYNTYPIYVNGEKVTKPYHDVINLNKSAADRIKNIKFIDFAYNNKALAVGWVADLELLGCIGDSAGVGGIRLRSGNILIGDRNLLSAFFREERFNNYLVGEIYTIDNNLVLNSRRDDFEDNEYKEALYSSFVKEVGLPYSQEIRKRSHDRSSDWSKIRNDELLITARKIHRNGHISKKQKNRVLLELKRIISRSQNDSRNELLDLFSQVGDSRHFLEINYTGIPVGVKSILTRAFDIIYENCGNKKEAESIITSIIRSANSICCQHGLHDSKKYSPVHIR